MPAPRKSWIPEGFPDEIEQRPEGAFGWVPVGEALGLFSSVALALSLARVLTSETIYWVVAREGSRLAVAEAPRDSLAVRAWLRRGRDGHGYHQPFEVVPDDLLGVRASVDDWLLGVRTCATDLGGEYFWAELLVPGRTGELAPLEALGNGGAVIQVLQDYDRREGDGYSGLSVLSDRDLSAVVTGVVEEHERRLRMCLPQAPEMTVRSLEEFAAGILAPPPKPDVITP